MMENILGLIWLRKSQLLKDIQKMPNRDIPKDGEEIYKDGFINGRYQELLWIEKLLTKTGEEMKITDTKREVGINAE